MAVLAGAVHAAAPLWRASCNIRAFIRLKRHRWSPQSEQKQGAQLGSSDLGRSGFLAASQIFGHRQPLADAGEIVELPEPRKPA